MNLLRSWFGGTTHAVPEVSVTANPNWQIYRAGEGDRAGRKITRVYAVGDGYVIYFIGCELYYETSPTLEKDLLNLGTGRRRLRNVFLRGKNRSGGNPERDSRQAAGKGGGTAAAGVPGGTVLITALVWGLYLGFHSKSYMPAEWYPWILAAALAMLGGLFSVCLNLGSLEVNVNQDWWFLGIAGMTRSIIAFLAGIALLLAMRSKMFAGIVYPEDELPSVVDRLQIAEMFFCFLAGFSESFVPNILSKSADPKSADSKAAADQATADKGAAEKAAADKLAADKASADKAAADNAPADKAKAESEDEE